MESKDGTGFMRVLLRYFVTRFWQAKPVGDTMRDLFDIFLIAPGGPIWCEEAGDAATAIRRAAARSNADHCEYLIVSELTGERISLANRPQPASESQVNAWVEKHSGHLVGPTL
jgi:hypothetical protein